MKNAKSWRVRALLSVVALWPVAAVAQPLPVKTVTFDAPSVGRKMKYNIVLPADYEKSDNRYPVLYLLHGLTSNYTSWARMGVPSYARNYDLIVVMPDAGNSWYVNWAESEDGQKNDWEDCIAKDLVGHIDKTYRTIAKREGRAINGLSMGGYGGLVIGLRNPDEFCSIGSHSGALGLADWVRPRVEAGEAGTFRRRGRRNPSNEPNARIGIEGFSSQAERTPKGTMFSTVEECDAHDLRKLVLKVPRDKLPHIYIDCGTDDRLLSGSRKLAEVLRENEIPFTYAESPGGHNGDYWRREVGQSMAVQYAIIQRNLRRSDER